MWVIDWTSVTSYTFFDSVEWQKPGAESLHSFHCHINFVTVLINSVKYIGNFPYEEQFLY